MLNVLFIGYSSLILLNCTPSALGNMKEFIIGPRVFRNNDL